jgi:hypothetical protein
VTTFIEEPTVPLAEVAKRAGLTVDDVQAEATELGFYIGETGSTSRP